MSVVRLNDLDFQASGLHGARLEVETSDNSKCTCRSDLVPVVQTLDSAIDHYPVDRYLGNRLCCLLERDLSSG